VHESKPWRRWNRFDWSAALLESYFRIPPDGQSEPVRILVVTDDRLCQVAGETVGAGEEVRQALIDKTLAAVGEKNFWTHANEKTGKPDYLAHLIVACIAAVDGTDLDERSYLKALPNFAGPTADHHLEIMPELWSHLERWLAERPDEYRPIILPDPRGWVRIGHTTRLAFPSRPDQAKLRELLADQDLAVDEVPLGAVVKALEGSRRTFSNRFIEEMDAFGTALRSGATPAALYETPLWSAITSASMLDIEDRQSDASQRWTVVGLDDGYEFDLRVVTNGGEAPPPFQVVECDEPFGLWTHELLTSDSTPAIAFALSDRSLHLGNLSGVARGGLIPLVEAPHGALELASKQDFEFVKVALVADRCRDEAVQRFDGKIGSRGCGVPGWTVLRDVRLRTGKPEIFEGSALEQCWILHDTPFPPSLRLVGGVRIGDALLGKRSTLPRVRAVGAARVTATTNGLDLELTGHDGYWSFPTKGSKDDIDGNVGIRAYFAAGIRERQVRFVGSPTSEAFRAPGDRSAWQVEGAARSQSLSSAHDMYADELQSPMSGIDRVTRLARNVGVFAVGEVDTTWEIAAFGSSSSGRLISSLPDAVPTHRSASDGDRRRWRKALGSARFKEGDPARSIARGIVAAGGADKDLPEVKLHAEYALAAAPKPCRQAEDPRVQDLVDVMCAMSNRAAGVEPAVWRKLCQETLGLGWQEFKVVTRAWSEANLLDELANRRWSSRRVLAVQPHLVAFQTGRWVGATLQGLALSVSRLHLKNAAAAESVLVETIRSRSGLVPDTVTMRAATIDKIESVAQRMALPVRWLRSDPFRIVPGRDLTVSSPGDYERSTYGHDLTGFRGVTVDRWWKAGSPGMWTVGSELYSTWTHYESSAGLWASAFAGRPIVQPTAVGRLRRDGAYLPLSVARWINAIAPVLAGPDPSEDGAYFYECPSAELSEALSDGLDEFIEEQMTALATTDGAR
jgi:hypothetical protein